MTRRPLTAVLAALALTAPSPALANHEDGAPHGITTQGAAILTAKHDIARFTFGASVRRSTPSAAQSAASARLTRVISVVRRAGVAPADVRTGSIRLFRQTRRLPGGRVRVLGYRSSQSIRVTVRDLGLTSTVVDAAVKAGATSVSGPDFGISNRAEVYRQALRVALRDARAKAQARAEEAGVNLGRVIAVVENGNVEPTTAASEGRVVGDFDSGASSDDSVPTPVRPGTESIGAFVSVTFETT
jgi:uncharacterized protein YggE